MDDHNVSIDTLGLSVRSSNALHRAGVHTVEGLLAFTADDLLKIKNLGRKSADEVLAMIANIRSGAFRSGKEEQPEQTDPGIWVFDPDNREAVTEYLKSGSIGIDALEPLSARAYNLLSFAGTDRLWQIAFLSADELMEIRRMDPESAAEIEKAAARYLRENSADICRATAEAGFRAAASRMTVGEMMSVERLRPLILDFVKKNDVLLEDTDLPVRAKKRFAACGFKYLSDIVFMTAGDIAGIDKMGSLTASQTCAFIKAYLHANEERLRALAGGDETALFDDDRIRRTILGLYREIGFGGLSLSEMTQKLPDPDQIPQDRLKKVIGSMLAARELEYVDFRCFKVYEKFSDALEGCTSIDDRQRVMLMQRMEGKTFEAIAQENGLTRERVRQIVEKTVRTVVRYHTNRTGSELFDEDYYKYFYSTYLVDLKDAAEWLGTPGHLRAYFDLRGVKSGNKDLNDALEDVRGLDAGLRLKIKNYLNRNKLFVDGMWVEKRRADLELLVAAKFCTDEVSFDRFVELYNGFLRDMDVPYDANVYYTEDVLRTRKSRLSESNFILWKQNEMIRYYDIGGRDYTELFEALNLDSYENIHISTVKLMRENPEILEKYDIRDQYELHNLLRKAVPKGSFHDFRCGRMPMIEFGEFDRDAALFEMIVENSPIAAGDLTAMIEREYGFDPGVTFVTYLAPFSKYYHQGVYSIDQKVMPEENMAVLMSALNDDFYNTDELKEIYLALIPGADPGDINPYNLKSMGFQVYSRCVLRNYPSLDAYFEHMFTADEIIDLSGCRKRFVYVQSFSSKLMELKRKLRVIEFEPDRLISAERLERAGVPAETLRAFCDEVYGAAQDGEYFSIRSLKRAGFTSGLFDLGFSDRFYSNVLVSDVRLSYGQILGNLIFFKGKKEITIRSFETELIQRAGIIDMLDLMKELSEKYGCRVTERWDVLSKIDGTVIYYDKYLDRLYANKDLYYKELEGGV